MSDALVKDTVVFDLDGTLANIDHRTHLLRCAKPDWRGFYRSCVSDTPNEWCVTLIRSLFDSGFKVVIVSARSKEVEQDTFDWIEKNVCGDGKYSTTRRITGRFEVILLREEGDYTPDQILKKKWLDSYGKDRILFVVDDRTRVVDMWRENGLTCLQCARWEEYKRPKTLRDIIEGKGRNLLDMEKKDVARALPDGNCDTCGEMYCMCSCPRPWEA